MRPLTQNIYRSNDSIIVCPPMEDEDTHALVEHDTAAALDAAAGMIATCDEVDKVGRACIEQMNEMEKNTAACLAELKKSGDDLMAAIDDALEGLRRMK